ISLNPVLVSGADRTNPVAATVLAPDGTTAAFGVSSFGGIQLWVPRPVAGDWTVVLVTAEPLAFTGDLAVELGKSLAKIPTKIGALVHSIGGGERDPETPISVVGASIIGGDAFERGLYLAFWFFLAQLNFVLGAVNLVPLLPFDGGHIAIALFEKIRNMIRKARGSLPAAPVNYLKLMPATYVILVVVIGYMALTVTADFVNPIRPFQ
ncbi:MAG TPA: M50 family metallopeptidase, partial [Mycobacterium sp.]|nr:M50 family metallopeptidase [Mycobacterium sp.]